jgi:RNA polymerase sigma factor (sigma-70 family)
MMRADAQLLRDYAEAKSQDAFAELVRRHLDLVYSAALRQVRSPQHAEEISQSVFTDLARAAEQLKPDTVLTAWLYQVARRTAIDVIRRESRRQARERLAVEMAAMNTSSDWANIEPLLDDAMETLDEPDRAAILLRFFENKSLREVGQSLGTSDDAAQKRVSRAVERLREYFSKHGVAIGASGLVVLISANAVQSAPLTLTASVSSATALTGTMAGHSSTAITATKAITMTTLQKVLVTATVALVAGAGIYEGREAAHLHEATLAFQKQQASATAEMHRLQQERDDATRKIETLSAENMQLKSNTTTAELLALRGKVTRFEADEKDPLNSTAKDWLGRVNKLKQRLEQSPDAKIPELQFVTDQDWLNAAHNPLDTEIDYRRALATLRNAGQGKFAGTLHDALQKYSQANSNQFPADLAQLQSYFDSPVDNALLERWQIVPMSKNGLGGDFQITQKSTPDEFFDSRINIGLYGYGSGSDFMQFEGRDLLAPVYKAYKAANGQSPPNASQLLPYATTPEQQAFIQKMAERDALTK